MKEQLLANLDAILTSTTSIKNHVDRVYEIRMDLEPLLTDIEKLEVSYSIKSRVQTEVNKAFDLHKGWGVFLGATGVGKTKVVIDRIRRSFHEFENNLNKRLIVVPTEKLRDIGWRDEFIKWNCLHIYNQVQTICYASLHTIEGQSFDEVYFDEIHNGTENSIGQFFKQNNILSAIGLTATKPNSKDKINLFKSVGLYPVYEITVEEAIKLGIIAPYAITVITVPLDNTNAYIKAGNKFKTWYQTEQAAYEYITKKAYGENGTKFDLIRRRQILSNLKSKTEATKFVLGLIPIGARGIIFCGSKKQAVELCEYTFFTKPTKPKAGATLDKVHEYELLMYRWSGDKYLGMFMDKEIDRLACVDALNEGMNLPDVDYEAMPQVDSNPINFIQRLGRGVRFRPGHIGRVIIFATIGTEDMLWVSKCTRGLRVRYVAYEDIRSGKETVFINEQ